MSQDKKTFRFVQPVIDEGIESVMQMEVSFSPRPKPGLDADMSQLIARGIAEEFGAWLAQATDQDLEQAKKNGLGGWTVGDSGNDSESVNLQ
jgi:hypothetical protein